MSARHLMRWVQWLGCALAIGFAAAPPSPARFSCAGVLAAKRADAALLCLAQFQVTGDRATGALTARALEDLRIENELIGVIASRVGDSPEGADAWNALGDVHRHARRNAESINAYHRALAHRGAGDLKGQIHDAVGLYNRYDDDSNYVQAMAYMGMAYELAHRLGDPHELGYVLAGVSSIILDLGDLPLAQQLVDEAAATIDEHDEYWVYVMALRAAIAYERGRYRTSEVELARALDVGRTQPHLSRWVLRETLAQAWTQLHAGELDAASHTLASVTVDPSDPWADEDGARKALSEALIATARNRFDDALAIIERVRGAPKFWQTQLDSLRGRALARMGRREDAEPALRLAIAHVEERRAEISLDSVKPWKLATLREPFEDLFELLVAQGRAVDALMVAQRATARSVFDGLVTPLTSTEGTVPDRLKREGEWVTRVRALVGSSRASEDAAIPGPGALASELADCTVLTYFRAGQALWLVAMHHGATTATRIADLEEVRSAIAAWEQDPDQAAALGPLLLPPGALPSRDETIYIAVDEPLQRVAFSALRIEHGYLIERNPVVYVPSASVLAIQLRRPPRGDGAVVIGDPENNLPAAHREAIEVARALGVSPVLGSAGTRQVALAARDAALLHIASHAEVGPHGAALRLADGLVTAGELIDAGRAPHLVVLSSCSSADAVDRAELGPLANAFIAAGARAVVASRWTVPDEVALEFSRAFYASGGARDPIRGVARAQRTMIDAGKSRSIWSTFVVIGTVVSPTQKAEDDHGTHTFEPRRNRKP